MNNLIKKIEISNFRSIRNQIINCTEYNLFCGVNDVGKSNVLKALNLFFNGETDFQTQFNFNTDYNKISLATAQKADKQKQLIKIRVTFNVPKGFKSLAKKSEFTIEKIYDRNEKDNLQTKYIDATGVEKASMARIFNRVKFVYIPALKGESVMQYMLGLLGDFQLINSSEIERLNKSIQSSTKDLAALLLVSKFSFETSFGLPTLLSDFWQKLSVGTSYEYLSEVEKYLESSAKKKDVKLNPSTFQIPLKFRGDGIKSKYIPAMLLWLQSKSVKSFYVWGIDEPENSLEFKASEEFSRQFSDEYATKAQIFGTTHSMAFINPYKDAKIKPQINKCIKNNIGETSIIQLNTLFQDEDKISILTDIGSLEIQQEIIEIFRNKIKDIEDRKEELSTSNNELSEVISRLRKPLVITEGKTDWKHLEASFFRLKESGVIQDIENFEFFKYEDEIKMGDTLLDDMCTSYAKTPNERKVIFIFDRDVPRFITKHTDDLLTYKSWGNNVYSFCIPKPQNRIQYNKIFIESYYSDAEIRTIDVDANTRLFFTNELEEIVRKNLTTGASQVEYKILDLPDQNNEYDKSIQDKDVVKIKNKNGIQVAHSKNVFAENIRNKKAGFNEFDVTNFVEIYNIINTILSLP